MARLPGSTADSCAWGVPGHHGLEGREYAVLTLG